VHGARPYVPFEYADAARLLRQTEKLLGLSKQRCGILGF
jgi:hypothetical protein